MKIEVLFFAGCPNHRPTTQLVREVLRAEGISADVREIEVRETDQAVALGFLGSPSVRINGLDVEPESRTASNFGYGCRTYYNDGKRSGVPSSALIRRALSECSAQSAS